MKREPTGRRAARGLAPVDLGARVIRDPQILDGEPTLRRTRVPVRSVVEASRLTTSSLDLVEAFPMLDSADIEAALAFYDANRAEIERYIAEN